MCARHLPNYIRSHRKRNAFSQEEVAFLLDCQNGARISRYEHFTQQPSLETAIALEILFRTPVRSLFAGVSTRVEQKVARRAKALSARLEGRKDRATIWKLQVLEAVRAGGDASGG